MLISAGRDAFVVTGVAVRSGAARRIVHGIDLQLEGANGSSWTSGQAVRLRNEDGQLIAVGSYDGQRGTVHPQVVIVNA